MKLYVTTDPEQTPNGNYQVFIWLRHQPYVDCHRNFVGEEGSYLLTGSAEDLAREGLPAPGKFKVIDLVNEQEVE